MVLLENHNHALPLSTSASSIAVVGPLADNAATSSGPTSRSATTSPRARSVTVLEGIKNARPERDGHVRAGLRCRCTDTTGFGAAVDAAKAAAVTVVVRRRAVRRHRRGVVAQRHRPARPAAGAGRGDRGDRQAVRGRADERPAADDRLAGRQRAGAARGVVARDRGRRRRRRRAVRQGRPRRQAADVVPAQRRADPDLVQRAADRSSGRPEQQVHVEVPRRRQHPAVPVRVRAVVHHVLALEPAPVERPSGATVR